MKGLIILLIVAIFIGFRIHELRQEGKLDFLFGSIEEKF